MSERPVIDPLTGAPAPHPLRFRAGSAPGVSFRVRGPGEPMPAPESVPGYGSVEAAFVRWKRVGVITGVKGAEGAPDSYRFFVLELDPGAGEQTIELQGFYVRGPFRVVEKVNNARRAREAWEAFRGE